jgi:hypothetical protein
MRRLLDRYEVTTQRALIRAIRDELIEETWEEGDGPKPTLLTAELMLDGMLDAEYERIAGGR